VIVNVERRSEVDLRELPDIFLRKRRFWREGGRIVPVNRNAGSRARLAFERRVLDAESSQLASYWNRQYYRGVLPPATLASDAAVLRFVASEPRAIGYVLADAVDDSVRVLMRIGVPPTTRTGNVSDSR